MRTAKKAIISLVFGIFCALLLTGTAWGNESLTITGNGVSQEISFSRENLQALSQQIERQCYSLTNNYPTNKTEYAAGISLAYLLEQAGLKPEAQLIKVESTDGYTRTFTRQELLEDQRYFFSEKGDQQPVPVMVALKTSNKGFEDLEDSDLKLMLGQRVPGEQNNPWHVKYVKTIEVTTTIPTQWPQVTFHQAAGEKGEVLELHHTNFDEVKIYYTTDGSLPTIESSVYNLSASYYQPALNQPIPITAGLTVQAIAIGAGKNHSVPAQWPEPKFVPEPDNSDVDPAGVFNDLAGYEWAQPAIEALAEQNMISGMGENRFEPGTSFTRAMFVTLLYRIELGETVPKASGSNPFPDVDQDSWYGPYVAWAVEKGLVSGYPDGTFRPEIPLTLEEMVSVVVRALGQEQEALQIGDNLRDAFAHETRISPWALPYIAYAESYGLLERGHIVTESERGLFLNGGKPASRAEAAVTLSRMMQN